MTGMKIVSIYVQKISMEGAQSSVRKGVVQFKRFPEDHTLLLKKRNVPLMQIADVPTTWLNPAHQDAVRRNAYLR